MKRTIWALILGAGIELPSFAGTIYVATNGLNVSPFSTPALAATNIQSAVNVATSGDIVLVGSGIYQIGSQISITNGIILRSVNGAQTTYLNGQRNTRGIYIDHPDACVEGFTIHGCRNQENPGNGYGRGGGILIRRAAVIDSCIIYNNEALGYGTMGIEPWSPASSGYAWGGGVYAASSASNAIIRNCAIFANNAWASGGSGYMAGEGKAYGGGLFAEDAITVENCTIAKNVAEAWSGVWSGYPGGGTAYGGASAHGGGVYVGSTQAVFKNSIITTNMALEHWATVGYMEPNWVGGSYSYCCTFPLPSGIGNKTNDPTYLDTASNNFHLVSSSPCINQGNNSFVATSSDLDGNPRIANGAVDMGAYENETIAPIIATSLRQMWLTAETEQPITNQVMEVWNGGALSLDYEVSTDVPWLAVQPSSGSSTGEHEVVTISVDPAGLVIGSYTGLVTISSTNANNSPQSCIVKLSVNPSYLVLNSSGGTFVIKEGQTTNYAFEVWSGRPRALDYVASSDVPWMAVQPTSGSSTGEHDMVSVAIDSAGLVAGSYTGHVTVVAVNAENSPQICTIKLTVLPRFIVKSEDQIALTVKDGQETNLTFEVWGDSPLALDYVISTNVPWMTVLPTSGSSTGEHDVVSVAVNTKGLVPGSYTGVVSIASTNAGNSPQTCIVTLTVVSLMLDHFAWSAIASPQHVDAPFMVGLTAQDAENLTVFRFTNTVSIVGLRAGGVVSSNISIGSETTTAIYPMGAAYHDQRTQVIYLPQEIGSACSITSLALNVTTIPGQPLTNWTIRLKHSSLNAYPASPVWEDSGWVTVYQANEPSGSTGWRTFLFGTPFEYNGTDSLIVDFSFNNASLSTDGRCQNSDMSVNRSITCRSNSSDGDPLSWSGTTPSPSPIIYVPNIRLGTTFTVPIAPWSSANFAGGVWNGTVAVNRAVANMFLQANDGAGHLGNSANFSVIVPIADADGDSLPDDWEQQYYGGATNANPSAMASNGANTIMEAYLAGLDPTDSNSFFKVFSDGLQPSHKILYWPWASNRMYSVYWTSNLLSPQTWVLMTETAGGSYTDAVHESNSGSIYKIKVRQ